MSVGNPAQETGTADTPGGGMSMTIIIPLAAVLGVLVLMGIIVSLSRVAAELTGSGHSDTSCSPD
jgi:hypothetical protein